MDKQQALAYITDVSWRESRLGLTRMRELLERVGNPQQQLKCIHIAGTNGKGSVSAMLSYILSASGYQTGLYTSPCIQSFHERFQINNRSIEDDIWVQITEEIKVHADAMADHPTEFELMTAIGFMYFHRSACDVVVLEVGLGGRLDATNIIPTPEIGVITAIGLDHMAELGDTIEQIAAEKAGIIKPGGHVVLYPQTESVKNVFSEICQWHNAHLTYVNLNGLYVWESDLEKQRFDYGEWKNLTIPLLGAYQLNNAAAVLTVIRRLRQKGWKIPDNAVRDGLAGVKWPARFEIIRTSPIFVVDGGHNPQGVEELVRNIRRYFPGKEIIWIMGVMADKDYVQMCQMVIPFAKKLITVTPDNPRALSTALLADCLKNLSFDSVVACDCVEQGVETALRLVKDDDVICAFGSLYMAGRIRSFFQLS